MDVAVAEGHSMGNAIARRCARTGEKDPRVFPARASPAKSARVRRVRDAGPSRPDVGEHGRHLSHGALGDMKDAPRAGSCVPLFWREALSQKGPVLGPRLRGSLPRCRRPASSPTTRFPRRISPRLDAPPRDPPRGPMRDLPEQAGGPTTERAANTSHGTRVSD